MAWAQHWARHAPLPQPGTFEEELLAELAERQKNLQYARMYVLADLLAASGGVPSERVAALLDLFEAELHHDTYDPAFVARKRAELAARADAVRRQIAAVERQKREAAAAVAAMTVSDEDLKPPGG